MLHHNQLTGLSWKIILPKELIVNCFCCEMIIVIKLTSPLQMQIMEIHDFTHALHYCIECVLLFIGAQLVVSLECTFAHNSIS